MIIGATEADLASIASLIAELLAAVDTPPNIDLRQAVDNCRALLKEAAHHILVAKQGGVAVGFIHVTMRRTVLHKRASGLIDELVVSRDFRSQGIGKRLLSAAVDTCRKLGCCEVEVSTEMTNVRARDFYKKCGFGEEGVLLEKHFDD